MVSWEYLAIPLLAGSNELVPLLLLMGHASGRLLSLGSLLVLGKGYARVFMLNSWDSARAL